MAAGAWKLIIEDDAGKQIVVPFTRDVITIGRKEGNTIRLTERNVSRNHAKLSKDNGHVVIEDLGSFNGIKLNGDRIDGRVLVHEGDTIQIGDYHLALHAQDGAKAGNGQQTAGAHGQGGPQPRSQAANAPTADDDEFAGDTQRWEPPQGMQGISVQTLPTQEDRAIRSDEMTDKAPHVGARAAHGAQGPTVETAPVRLPERDQRGGGFSADNGDTERVSLDMLSSMDPLGLDSMKSGAPSSRVRDEPELEPTVRQAPSPAAPAPISVPGGGPIGAGAPGTGTGVSAQGGVQPLPSDRVDTRPERSAPHGQQHGQHGQHGHGQHAQHGPASAPQPHVPHTPAAPPRTPPLASAADVRAVLEEQTAAVRPSPSASDETLPRLVVLNTIFAGSAFPLRTAEAVIGRTEDNDITIEHKSVSRNHAKIVREGDRVRILDLKSANGVLVNNEEVEQAVLRSGDVVELGRVRMRFVPIGEKFVVPPDEIERARIADRAGDDFENDSGTGVTNPVRKKQAAAFGAPSGSYETVPSTKPRNVIYLALGIVIGLLVVVVLLFVLNKDDEPKTDAPPDTPKVGVNPLDSIPAVKTDDKVEDTAAKVEVKDDEPKTDATPDTNAKPTDSGKVATNDPNVDNTDSSARETKPPSTKRKEIKEKEKDEPRRPSSKELEAIKTAGNKAYLFKDFKTAVEELGKYRRWIKDDATVNRNFDVAQRCLKNKQDCPK